ncbi:hypothetical protein NBZ79_02110 [Sneathiella marina]|uniref:Lipoprotein n=1 Tax=Sneathiella marina TaxID=2950108 RepID=A0ABY4WAS9_9PROT|nr:hypothetical protein [Sneathiella marina]USG61766.1 hypothetical protein NBZ79_02110 [Sneathiella marina]
MGSVVFLAACTTDIVKSIDKQISEYAGINCSATNLSVGEDYCQSPKQSFVQASVYCYKTMGGVDCYRQPNPYHTEKSERVRQTLSLGSYGAEVMTAEEFELRQIMAEKTKSSSKPAE